MTTWSTVNGKIIKSISNDEENEHLENQYELYKANKTDKSYTNNFTQMNKFSYSLVIAKQPCKDDPLPMIRQKTQSRNELYHQESEQNRSYDQLAPFENKSLRIRPSETQKNIKKFEFKLLTMSDTGGLINNSNSQLLNSLLISFADKKKEISVNEEFCFKMAV